MAEAQKDLDLIESIKIELEQALPQITAAATHEKGIEHVNVAAELMTQVTFDEDIPALGEIIGELNNLKSTSIIVDIYQAYLTDALEMFVEIAEEAKNSGLPKSTNSVSLMASGLFLIKYASRVMNRYRIKIMFEPEYEAKGLRAFMVLKELSNVCRFLNVTPDITSEENPNLEEGLDVDILSQENPESLHKMAGSVLEVQSVNIFTETKQMQVKMLDPPHLPNSFDNRVEDYLNN